ncbi:cytochrome P450, partial [Streptomyces sp. MS191]|uniref:cytochrome P450 n=1 Tax=Streptomyces sp. ms191 TaxID=1827978 RepID=UPI0021C9D459
MELLGIEGVDPATLVRWSDASLELFWGRPAPERQLELAELAGEFHRWLTATVRDAEAAPDSFVGALARHLLPDGRPLDVATAVGACFFVFIAGQSTTGQLISTVLHRALTEPGLWPRPASEPGLAEAWVEEVLRREPPVTTWRRVTAHPVELGGVRLPAGAHLLLMLMGTGSDPEVFGDPELMCPHRPNARHHLAFGVGRHRCPALTEPGLWPRPASEPGLAEAWVEEVLRREPPVTTWRRVTAHPVELGGVRLPAGAHLLLMLMGTGSDPEVFGDPELMCPHRPNARHHLAFGVGRHRCPGASLARTEAAVALRAAARRLPDVRLAGAPEPGTATGRPAGPAPQQPPMLGLLSFRAPLRVPVVRR